MSDRSKIRAISYGTAVSLGLVMVVSFLSGQDLLNQAVKDVLRLLSDAFMLPGFLMVAAGLMVWIANEGTLDGVSFVLIRAVKFLLPFGRGEKDESYGEYVARQAEKRVKGYGFLFVTGGIFMGLSLVFLALFLLN